MCKPKACVALGLSAVVFSVVVLVPLVWPESARAHVVERVSVDSGGVEGDLWSNAPSINADGRYVAFESSSRYLVSGDTNSVSDIFVHDRQTGITERVSVDSAGDEANDHSYAPSISADGRYVAFHSSASDLVLGDTNEETDIFVHDRQTGITSRASVTSGGAEGNGGSMDPSISADGRYVAFWSEASNLVSGDTNAGSDVFVRDRTAGTTERVSVNSSGVEGDLASEYCSLSANGRYVAFCSYATNLVGGDTNGAGDVFVRDRTAGITERVSVDSAGTEGDLWSNAPSISSDGRYVAFASAARNLVPNDTNTDGDVFVHDRDTQTTTRASVDSVGAEADNHSFAPAISDDGRYVAFHSLATDLVPGDTNTRADVFVRDRQAGTTSRLSVADDWTQGDYASEYPSMSTDGRHVAFESTATNLVPADTNSTADVFVAINFPTITGVTPAIGPAAGGTSVTITGTGFVGLSGESAVTFGGTPATSYVVQSHAEITAVAPAHASGTAQVQVTATGGTSEDTEADDFTYVAPPTINGLDPAYGPTAGGVDVVITGTDFVGVTAVTFDGTNAMFYHVDSSTQITAKSWDHAVATVQVQVTTVYGSSEDTEADDYTYADNHVEADFDTSHQYRTDDDSVENVALDGFLAVITGLPNMEDDSGGEVVGASTEGGPVLDLATSGATSDVCDDHLTSGAVPGASFTWGPAAIGENEAWGCWANLEGTASYEPGFAVSRSADQTLFDYTGGTQVLTITVTPEEAIENLTVRGNVHPADYAHYTSTIQSVTWETDPPSFELNYDGAEFQGRIHSAQSGVTYTLHVTTDVASTIDGTKVVSMPEVAIWNSHTVVDSSSPPNVPWVGSGITWVLDDGTWTWTVEGIYVWHWYETESRAVFLNSHVNGAYTLTYNAGTGGSISGDTPQTVEHGSDGAEVTAVADSGYHFVNWSDASTDNPRQDTGVTGNMTVTANFALNEIVYSSLRGVDRFDTAIKISQAMFPAALFPEGLPADSGVVLAPGWESYQEALCGAPLASAYGGPVLLSSKTLLYTNVKNELVRLDPDYVFCIGLSSALADAVRAALPSATVSSMNGSGAPADVVYDMSRQVANALADRVEDLGGDISTSTAIVTIGNNFPDAIGVSPVACANLWPIILTDKAGGYPAPALHASAAATFTDLGITTAIKVGTYAVLPTTVTGLTNCSGADRYFTNANVAVWAQAYAGLSFTHTALTTGDKFPDALAGGPYLALDDGTLLLSPLAGPLPVPIGALIAANSASVQHFTFIACIEPVISQVKALLD